MHQKKRKQMGLVVFCALLLIGCKPRETSVVWQEPVLLKEEKQTEEKQTEYQSEYKKPETITVDISGAVYSPGVYRLEAGSRICDVIELAGGLCENADRMSLNQAQILQDEAKIHIYTEQELHDKIQKTESEGMTESSKININKADLSALCTLPGIGESRARDIIAYREQNGPFSAIEEIMNVSGIKDATFQRIKEEIAVG